MIVLAEPLHPQSMRSWSQSQPAIIGLASHRRAGGAAAAAGAAGAASGGAAARAALRAGGCLRFLIALAGCWSVSPLAA
jgi:hypothetical protein